MNKYHQISRRVASTEVVALSFLAAKRPDDLFGGVFFDIRQKAKDLKEKWSQEAKDKLQKTLIKDLKGKGVKISSVKISLGKYRGSRFVTSAKITVVLKDEKAAQGLLKYLQAKYSPKFKLKSFNEESGEAFYNVR